MVAWCREAGPEDVPALNKLTHQLGYPIPEKETLRNLETIRRNRNEIVYVAISGEEVIAWVHVFHTIRLESGSFCELGGLVVEERFRGKGIGKMLIEKAREWCAGRGVQVLRLRSNVIRKEAHRFYRNLGFGEIKEQKVFDLKTK